MSLVDMKSKGYQRFYTRLDYFRLDREVADIFVKNKELLAGEDKIFSGVTATGHPLLNARENTEYSRTIVVKHLRNSIYVSFIKEIYEEVTEYIRYILRQAALNGADTNRLLGEHNVSMKANDILSKATKEEIVQLITDQMFQQLENERSTMTLIQKIKNKLGLTIEQSTIDSALPYLECRHVFVHSDGRPNADFLAKYPFVRTDAKGRINLTAEFLIKAFNAVNRLLLNIDKEMIRLNYIPMVEQIH